MNIFVLDRDPVLAAQMQCDKHVVKMVLETAQLLCSVFPDGEAPYKKTHYNHPCSVWTRTSVGNFNWLLEHGDALSKEYSFRYNKIHKCDAVISWCRENVDYSWFKETSMTEFQQCVPVDYMCGNVVSAYRKYYIKDKSKFAKWGKTRSNPIWFKYEE